MHLRNLTAASWWAAVAWALGAAAGAQHPEPALLPPPPVALPEVVFESDPTAVPAVRLDATSARAAPVAEPAEPPAAQTAEPVTGFERRLLEAMRRALPDGGADYSIERVVLPAGAEVPPAGDVEFSFRLPTRGVGAVTWTATVLDERRSAVRRVSGSAWLDRDAVGLQVTRAVPRGRAIERDDVALVRTRLSQLPRGALDRLEAAVGAVARSELRPGQWLTDQMVAVPDLVRRGQAVTIRLQRGPITITASGLARESGPLGSVIRVENAQSRRELFAKVVADDLVEVVF